MVRHGDPPYLECSSRGDTRFSAFYARPRSLRGQSIEQAYQALKRFPDGSTGLHWRQAKGRSPVNYIQCKLAFTRWWVEWVREQGLLPVLQSSTGLSDMFGQRDHTNQCTVLWGIRNGDIT